MTDYDYIQKIIRDAGIDGVSTSTVHEKFKAIGGTKRRFKSIINYLVEMGCVKRKKERNRRLFFVKYYENSKEKRYLETKEEIVKFLKNGIRPTCGWLVERVKGGEALTKRILRELVKADVVDYKIEKKDKGYEYRRGVKRYFYCGD